MDVKSWRLGTIISAVLAAMTLLVGPLWLAWPSSGEDDGVPAPTTTSTVVATTTTTEAVTTTTSGSPEAPPTCEPESAVMAALSGFGFQDEDILFEGDFDLGLSGATDAGVGRFSPSALTDKDSFLEFISGDGDNKTKARQLMLARLPKGERENAITSPDRWVGFQMIVPVLFEGNTTISNSGDAVAAGTRHVAPGDIWWVFVDSDCGVHITAAVRAACGNPQTEPPRPVIPSTTTTSTSVFCGSKCEELIPTTTANVAVTTGPPRTTPLSTTTIEKSIHEGSTSTITVDITVAPDSGSGAMTTVISPTTAAPAVTHGSSTTYDDVEEQR